MRRAAVILGLMTCTAARAQDASDVSQMLSRYERRPPRQEARDEHTARSLITVPLKLPLLFYKAIVSEQLSASCQFHPSCSQFCLESLDEFGVLKAVFLTADRLTRCNGAALVETNDYLIRDDEMLVEDNPGCYKFRH